MIDRLLGQGINFAKVTLHVGLDTFKPVQVDNIHTVSKKRLEKYVGTLDKDSILEISRKVVLALELESCLYES